MNKTVFYIVFCWFSISLYAQTVPESENLVPNGSFEEYEECPEYFNNLGVTSLEATGWLVPTLGSPDYFNTCSTQEVGVPQNLLGYQTAREGKAYAGFMTTGSIPNYREYIATKLKKQLTAGRRYFWCLWVSLADSVSLATNNIGIALTNDYITSNDDNVLNLEVFGNSNNVISESEHWFLISGSFIAKGNEKYLYIGNFYTENKTSIIQILDQSFAGKISYYYIDNIYLGTQLCTPIKIDIPNVFTPNNDGMNDFYSINLKGIDSAKIEILNRWGNIVFSGRNKESWDGQYNGKPCDDGVYFVIIEYFDYTQNKKNKKTGFVHLIR